MRDQHPAGISDAIVAHPRLEAVDLKRPRLIAVADRIPAGVREVERAERVAVDPDVDCFPAGAPGLDAQVEVASGRVGDHLRPLDSNPTHAWARLHRIIEHRDAQRAQRVDGRFAGHHHALLRLEQGDQSSLLVVVQRAGDGARD
jgi:hypothetical protein